MTATPQPMIVGSQGGWALPVAFADRFGQPVDVGRAGLVAFAEFIQTAPVVRTTVCKVLMTDAASGRAVATVPPDVVLSTLQQAGNASLGAPAQPAPVRLHAYVVDGQGVASCHVFGLYQPVDPRTADPASIPALQPLAVTVGPAGAPGAQGQPGPAGAAGSADPQPVTLAGPVAAHQAVFLGKAGALVASCDQPAQFGAVLGLALAAGALGDAVPFSAGGVLTDLNWSWTPGPIFLGIGGALTQQVPVSAAFVQQMAVALSPTSLRMGLRPPVLIEAPVGALATYRDMAGGAELLRGAAQVPGTPNAVVATGPDGYLPAALLAPGAVKSSRLAGGPQLASLPNGAFEDGFDGWTVATQGTGEASIDVAVSAVGARSAYLHCPAPGDVAALASSPVPVGEGVPVYVAVRAMLRSGTALAVLSAIFYDRNGKALGAPAQVGAPLALTGAFAEFGGYVLPPTGTRYGAAAVSNTGAAGAAGAVNVDELMLHRQAGGPAAWQVRRAARPAIAGLGGTMAAFLATLGDPEATDGSAEAGSGPAPIGGILYGALSLYLQTLGLRDPDLTRQLAAIWAAATAVLPSPPGAPAPPPVVVSAKTSQVVSAVRPVLVQRGGAFSRFVADYVGDGDAPDRSWKALYVDPAAPIGGVLYGRLLAYLTGPGPAGLSQPQAQSVADLASAWAAAPAIAS